MLSEDTLTTRCIGEGRQGCFTISLDETTRAELHATEVAHDEDDDLRQPQRDEDTMNGLTSRPRGLAIVIRTIGITCRTQTISPAHMASIVVAGTHFAHTLQRLLLGRHGIGVGEELTSLL